MKKYILLIALLVSGITFAQEQNIKLEAIGDLVKTTYYFDSGQVQQEGFFKDGKLDGVWTSYSTNGTKIAVATYKNGEKTGKWFFWNNDILHEVDYTNSKIAAVKTWKRDAIANN